MPGARHMAVRGSENSEPPTTSMGSESSESPTASRSTSIDRLYFEIAKAMTLSHDLPYVLKRRRSQSSVILPPYCTSHTV